MIKKQKNIKQNIENEEIKFYLNRTTRELEKITNKTLNLYYSQCQFLRRQIKALIKMEPNKRFESAYIKWQKELCTLEDNYALIFDKYLKEKKELDKTTRLNLY